LPGLRFLLVVVEVLALLDQKPGWQSSMISSETEEGTEEVGAVWGTANCWPRRVIWAVRLQALHTDPQVTAIDYIGELSAS
jgi:hypothetical protein